MDEEIKYPITDALRFKFEKLNSTMELKDKILKSYGRWFSRINYQIVMQIIEDYSIAKADFWNNVIKTYPELANKSVSANYGGITELKTEVKKYEWK